MVKNLFKILMSLWLLTGCQSLYKKRQTGLGISTPAAVANHTATTSQTVVIPPVINQNSLNSSDRSSTESSNSDLPPSSLAPVKTIIPKFGVILSGGGVRTWAHLAVLKELQKYRFPIVSIAGVEWGAVPAAIYAMNTSVNEIEWEMSKFKDLDGWRDFLNAAFAKKSTFDLKIPFACPSLNIKNKTAYILNRGQLDQFLPYCLPAAGLTKPYGNSVAYLSELAWLIQHLKNTGAQKIIFINVLSSPSESIYIKNRESIENQIWTQYAAGLNRKIQPSIDEIIDIDLSDYAIDDFDKRREVMVKGMEQSYNSIRKLADKYKL